MLNKYIILHGLIIKIEILIYYTYFKVIIITKDREIFVLKIFRALKFHGAKFS